MTKDQRVAWWGLGGLAALTALGFAFDPDRAIRRRLGAIRRDALVVDNPGAYRRRRRRRRARRRPSIAREIAACERFAAKEARPRTFRRKNEAVRALLDANPELASLVESDCGADCSAYTHWTEKRGRRGPKPRARAGDGRFDPLNERFERRTPGRKVASWREALDVTAPSTRHWEDFGGRVPVLEEATGLRLNLPARAEAVHRARLLAAQCQDIEAPRPRARRTAAAVPF
jgi:hypothetical protein